MTERIEIGDAVLEVKPSGQKMPGGLPYWRWSIEVKGGPSVESGDISWTPSGGEMMGTMVSFLATCAESLESGEGGTVMFPESLHEWVRDNVREIQRTNKEMNENA